MKKPIEVRRSMLGSWHVTYRGYTATSRRTFLGALYGAWYFRRLDHPGRKIKLGEIPGRGGRQGLQVQWAPRRWVLFYRLGGGWTRVVRTRGVAPLDLAAADDARFERFHAASRDILRVGSPGPGLQPRTCNQGTWQTFTWDGGPVPPGPRGERHSWPDDTPDPGDPTAG